ncbi:hypothetical protein CDL15_Pgr005107 [Punica granatum]|uniref:Uncharacterized protein n=1 Tax=Punica granatum TaxID=22663 RepID=A0A218WPY1_PUNGR|nr:hypothetical protein CDL15_Pgr005107 [Punica granatum]
MPLRSIMEDDYPQSKFVCIPRYDQSELHLYCEHDIMDAHVEHIEEEIKELERIEVEKREQEEKLRREEQEKLRKEQEEAVRREEEEAKKREHGEAMRRMLAKEKPSSNDDTTEDLN